MSAAIAGTVWAGVTAWALFASWRALTCRHQTVMEVCRQAHPSIGGVVPGGRDRELLAAVAPLSALPEEREAFVVQVFTELNRVEELLGDHVPVAVVDALCTLRHEVAAWMLQNPEAFAMWDLADDAE